MATELTALVRWNVQKKMAAPPRAGTFALPYESKCLTNLQFRRSTPAVRCTGAVVSLRNVQTLTRTRPILPKRLGWGESVPKDIVRMSVIGNAYPTAGNRKLCFGSSTVHDDEDDGSDSDVSAALASLIEENVRLRALVVQLSDLVLKNVVARK